MSDRRVLIVRLPWRAWLIYAHRWLGIAGCVLFLAWFASGIVMMYARMPVVTPDERLRHAAPLDLSTLRLSPAEAAAKAGVKSVAALQVGMLEGRPVYRFPAPSLRTVFADTGEIFTGMSEAAAMSVARRWSQADRGGDSASTSASTSTSTDTARQSVSAATAPVRYDALIPIADQWTLQTRQHLPLHRIALGDAGDSRVYVSNRTGEIVMQTTRSERFWAYLGPVTHWLYLPILRRNGPLWTRVIIWTSGIGCVMCLTGLVLGVVQFSPFARFRLRGVQSRTPYAGLMMWHHYAGLAFGVITLTWTFSGLLSMGPFEWLSDSGLTPAQRQFVTGASPSLDGLTVPRLHAAAAAIGRDFAPKELSLTFFRGEPFWISDAASASVNGSAQVPAPSPVHRLVSALRPEEGTFARFDDGAIERVARDLMPGVAITDATWLRGYDAYYYDRRGARPLPVLRVQYADAERTSLYLDPRRGAIALTLGTRGRLERWLYQGLHSLDFPFLYYRRPLWDIIVIVLSLGGIALGATTLKPAWVRLRRHVVRRSGQAAAALFPLRSRDNVRDSQGRSRITEER